MRAPTTHADGAGPHAGRSSHRDAATHWTLYNPGGARFGPAWDIGVHREVKGAAVTGDKKNDKDIDVTDVDHADVDDTSADRAGTADDLDSLDDDDNELDASVVTDDYDDDLDDDSDDDDSDDDDDDDDDYDDATSDEIDFVVALYREGGEPTVTELPDICANDLDELVAQLRRMPGDVGAVGAVSINGEFFVLCRVRGNQIQVLLNDAVASNDWPIARDVIDFLGLEVPDPDDDSEPVGDLDILADQGVSDFEMESIAEDFDEDSGELVGRVVEDMKFTEPFDKALGDDGP